MLAQNFKTPVDLGLTDTEFEALVKVLGMLEREEVAYCPHEEGSGRQPRGDFIGFNMYAFYVATDCGTVACICGWAEHVGNMEPHSLAKKRLYLPKLNKLFDPPIGASCLHGRTDTITVAQAAVALRNYLTTGEPRWSEALAT